MALLFNRVATVEIGTLGEPSVKIFGGRIANVDGTLSTEDGLKFQFNVERSDKSPNSLTLSLFNLSEATRSFVQKDNIVIVEAGYRDAVELLYRGKIKNFEHIKVGTDRVTKIQAKDGDEANTTKVTLSFTGKTTTKQVIDTLINQLGDAGVAAKEIAADLKEEIFENGLSVSGAISKSLNKLSDLLGFDWSIENNGLQITNKGVALTTLTPVLLTPKTGMIGSPALTDTGVKVTSFLQPSIVKKRAIEIRSENVNGFFVVEKVVHNGDTVSGPWTTQIDAVRLKAA